MFFISESRFPNKRCFLQTPIEFSVTKYFPKLQPLRSELCYNYKMNVTQQQDRDLGPICIDTKKQAN